VVAIIDVMDVVSHKIHSRVGRRPAPPAEVSPARGPPGGPHARVPAASPPARPGAPARRDRRGCRPLDGYARHLPRSISPRVGTGAHILRSPRSATDPSRPRASRLNRLSRPAPRASHPKPQRMAPPFPSARRSSPAPASVCSRRAISRRTRWCRGARTAATR
jgi:hypothetical protein